MYDKMPIIIYNCVASGLVRCDCSFCWY